MNYGKNNTKKRSKQLASGKHKAGKRFGITFLKTILIILLVLFIGGGLAFGLYANNLIKELPDISEVNISPTGYQTTVYDSDGAEIETLASSGANREYVTLDEIPDSVEHAFVSIEDSRFYEHNGIDIRGIIRAGFTAIINGGHLSQGASTITQQLLKNNYFTSWTDENTIKDKIDRKIQEQYLAVQLEKVYSKDEILENYLNTINLGQNTLGVEAASERYFNKSVSDLTISEAAVIAGITQNPSKYNPITNPENNATRREKVLKNMYDQGYITEAEYNEALADDVYDRIQVANAQVTSSSATSYFVDALTDQVIDDLMEQKGYTESEAYQLLYSGGLNIYSTQDTEIQAIVDEEVNNQDNYATPVEYSFSYRLTIQKADGTFENYSEQTMLSYYQAKTDNKNFSINYDSEEEAAAAIEEYKAEMMEEGDTIPEGGESIVYTVQPQTAMTVIDQSTGAVVALTGGRGDKTGSKTLNRATGITRQPGSTFKILAAYAPALDAGGLTLATVQDDAPMTYANGTSLSNYDNNYRGFTTIREAIEDSINVVAVKTLTQIGTGLGYEYVQDFGITTLESGDNNQALALGGITNGVTNLELAGAYATIANGGEYNKPIFYTTVTDQNGNVILDNTENKSKEVLKETTAYLLTSAMQDVMTQGTGVRANPGNTAVAGKSGTTTKDRDTVFAGFTPYYTAVIWGGYDDNTPQSSTTYSKNIWGAVMKRIHENLEYKDFTVPEGITQATVCKKSGKLALEGVCDSDPRGSMVYTEYFAEGTVPTETCDHHTSVTICNDSGQIASTFCPNTSTGVYIVGGSAGTGDAPYLLSEDVLNSICSLHTSASEDLDNLEIPNVTIDPIETGNGESSEGTSGSSSGSGSSNSSGSSSGSGTSGSGSSTSSGTTQTHSSN